MGWPGPAAIVRKKGFGDDTASLIPYEKTLGKMLV
jgi:hypothetical protein